MPSTPYAASAADTPIASAKRTKRRAQQSLASSVRRVAPCTDGSENKEGGGTAAPSVAASPDSEEAEAPSPPKAHKASMASTPRSSGTDADTARPVGDAGGRLSLGGDEDGDKEDENRHKPKESSIFSPALKPDHHVQQEARDSQAPACTVGAPEHHGGSAATAAEALPVVDAKKAAEQQQRGAEAEGEAAGRGVAQENEAGEDEGSGDDVPPGLRIREIEPGRDGDMEVGDGNEGEEQEEEEDEEEEFNPYSFIAHLPPYGTVKQHTPEGPVLPEKRKTRHGKELTLVLDLDETLVHCTVHPIVNPDHTFDVHFNDELFEVYVRKRPHLDSFLECVSELFEVVVFTASQQVYAEQLLNMIDPQKKYVKYRLYRDACMALEGNYLKDLNVLGRDLSKVAIVDNSPYAYGFQIDNGIPIESWFDDTADEELLHLLPFLKQLINESEIAGGDVRPFIRSIFKTHELVDKARNGAPDPGSPLQNPASTIPVSSKGKGGEGGGSAEGENTPPKSAAPKE